MCAGVGKLASRQDEVELEGTIISWNAGARRIFGYAASEIVGQALCSLTTPGARAELRQLLERARAGESISQFDVGAVTKDERHIEVSISISPVLDADGRVIATSTIGRECTERRLAENHKSMLLNVSTGSSALLHALPLDDRRGTASMWLLIATEALLFVTLFFAYFYLGRDAVQSGSAPSTPAAEPSCGNSRLAPERSVIQSRIAGLTVGSTWPSTPALVVGWGRRHFPLYRSMILTPHWVRGSNGAHQEVHSRRRNPCMSSDFRRALTTLVVVCAALGYMDYHLLGGARARALTFTAAHAATADAKPALRVCADPNNLPFSNQRGEGFENRLAVLMAEELHRQLQYTWWPQRRGFLKNTLNARRCDLLMGVPAGYDMVETTQPYYTSSYVFVTRSSRHLLDLRQ